MLCVYSQSSLPLCHCSDIFYSCKTASHHCHAYCSLYCYIFVVFRCTRQDCQPLLMKAARRIYSPQVTQLVLIVYHKTVFPYTYTRHLPLHHCLITWSVRCQLDCRTGHLCMPHRLYLTFTCHSVVACTVLFLWCSHLLSNRCSCLPKWPFAWFLHKDPELMQYYIIG